MRLGIGWGRLRGVGVGLGTGSGSGYGVGVGLIVGAGVGLTVGTGVGLALGSGVGDGVGEGVACAYSIVRSSGVAPISSPPRAPACSETNARAKTAAPINTVIFFLIFISSPPGSQGIDSIFLPISNKQISFRLHFASGEKVRGLR